MVRFVQEDNKSRATRLLIASAVAQEGRRKSPD